MRSPLISEHITNDRVLQLRLGEQILQTVYLDFQLLQPLSVRGGHATELSAPKVVASLGETVLMEQLLDRKFSLGFTQEANDLPFGETLLHVQPPQGGIGIQSESRLKCGGTWEAPTKNIT